MTERFRQNLEDSRRKLLGCLSGAKDVVFLRGLGNLGDDLIFAGTRQLLRDVEYRELGIRSAAGIKGEVALVSGSGGWSGHYSRMPDLVEKLEDNFERIVILPSSYDTSVPSVRRVLEKTKATVFARELASYELIRSLCRAEIALDCAFFFDYSPYRQTGKGTLTAYRTDAESGFGHQPPGNNDISETCAHLDQWLWIIARHSLIRSDRAHVAIAAALLGKEVEWRPTSYHKLKAIVEFALQDFPVRQTSEQPSATRTAAGPPVDIGEQSDPYQWQKNVWRMMGEISAVIPADASVLLVDDEQMRLDLEDDLNILPFLEREGKYWGPPQDDETAIRELERLRSEGADYMAFAWPCFWWLHHYSGLRDHLNRGYRQVFSSDRVLLFNLRALE